MHCISFKLPKSLLEILKHVGNSRIANTTKACALSHKVFSRPGRSPSRLPGQPGSRVGVRGIKGHCTFLVITAQAFHRASPLKGLINVEGTVLERVHNLISENFL